MRTTIRKSEDDPALVMEPDTDSDLEILHALIGVLIDGGEITLIRNGKLAPTIVTIAPQTVETA